MIKFYNKNLKTGFTLIELLAVIIILAVIALIATPAVLNIIEKANKEASKAAANGILDASKLYYAEMYLNGKGTVSNYECTFSENSGCDELSLTGELPNNGTIMINSNGYVNGKLVFDKNIFYICNSVVKETLDSTCSYTDYELVYEITNEGIITGFKTVEETAYIKLIPSVNASTLTAEATAHLQTKEITIPEYVGSVEVNGIASNAFSGYDITKITILSNKVLIVDENVFPTTLEKIVVKSCFTNGYSDYSSILETIPTDCKLYDKEAPLFGTLSDITINMGEMVDLTSGVVVTDNVGLEGTYTYSPESINTSVAGETIVTYKAIDIAGNIATATRKIIVKKPPICKRATSLHTEICNNSSSNKYCQYAGYSLGATITYGTKGTMGGSLISGNAFDCDVDGDGKYNPTTERFYYVSDLYNTKTKTFDDKYAVLIYYSNVSKDSNGNVKPDNTKNALIAYRSGTAATYYGPTTAKTNLPTTNQWRNVKLSTTTRAILTSNGNNSTGSSTNPTSTSNFSYAGYAARLITKQEVSVACNTTWFKKSCNYFVENTQYSGTGAVREYWMETFDNWAYAHVVTGESYFTTRGANNTSLTAVRPVIEVLKTDMQY